MTITLQKPHLPSENSQHNTKSKSLLKSFWMKIQMRSDNASSFVIHVKSTALEFKFSIYSQALVNKMLEY